MTRPIVNVTVEGPGNLLGSTYKTVVLKNNLPFASQIGDTDTKYVIKWDFDLNGQTITVPERCILEFDGGSLKNGTIIGQDTVFINVGDVDIWGDNLVRLGTWREHSGGGGGGVPDKPYDPTEHSGLGRKTLKLKDDGSNILTQEDFNQTNTVYSVNYDFNLNGQDIIMPTGCMLDMQGGSITNGILVSNDTVLEGVIDPSNVLQGAFRNGNMEYLNYNYKNMEDIKFDVKSTQSFYRGENIMGGYTPGACAVDENYIYQLSIYKWEEGEAPNKITHEDAYVFLFDRNYNYLGKTKLTYESHCNSACVKGGVLYVVNSGNVQFANTQSIVTNAKNNVPTATSTRSIYGGGFLSYDEKVKRFYSRGEHCMYVMDENFELLDDSLANPYETLDEYLHDNGYFINNEGHLIAGVYNNDAFISNGICVIGLGIGYFSSEKPASRVNTSFAPYIAKIDIYNNKVIQITPVNALSYGEEIEGIYPISESGYLLTVIEYGNTDDVKTWMFIEASEVQVNLEYYRGNLIYIDNRYKGKSNGSSYAPYKTLEEFLSNNRNFSGLQEVTLIGYEGQDQHPYIARESLLFGRNLKFVGKEETEVPCQVHVIFPFELQNSYVNCENLIFQPNDGGGNKRIYVYNSNAVFNNCVFLMDIYSTQATLELEDCQNFIGDTYPPLGEDIPYHVFHIRAIGCYVTLKNCCIYSIYNPSPSEEEPIDPTTNYLLFTDASDIIVYNNLQPDTEGYRQITCDVFAGGENESRIHLNYTHIVCKYYLLNGISRAELHIIGRYLFGRNDIEILNTTDDSHNKISWYCNILTAYDLVCDTALDEGELDVIVQALTGNQRTSMGYDKGMYWYKILIPSPITYHGKNLDQGFYYVTNEGEIVDDTGRSFELDALGNPATKYNKEITSFESNKRMSTSEGVGNVCYMNVVEDSEMDLLQLNVNAGDYITVEGAGGASARLWALINPTNHVILAASKKSEKAYGTDKEILYIEQNCILVVNVYNESYSPKYNNSSELPYKVVKYFNTL